MQKVSSSLLYLIFFTVYSYAAYFNVDGIFRGPTDEGFLPYNVSGYMLINQKDIIIDQNQIAFHYDITDYQLSIINTTYNGNGSISSIWYNEPPSESFTVPFDPFTLNGDLSLELTSFYGTTFYDENGVAYNKVGYPSNLWGNLPFIIKVLNEPIDFTENDEFVYIDFLNISRSNNVPECSTSDLLFSGIFCALLLYSMVIIFRLTKKYRQFNFTNI